MSIKRSTLGIDEKSLSALNNFIEKLNKEDKTLKISSKSFTEAAIMFFVKNQINPINYKENSVSGEIAKTRNLLLGFIIQQENTLLKPLGNELGILKKQLSILQGIAQKDDLLVLKNKLDNSNIDQELAAIETQAILMGLLQVLFDMMEVSEPERKRLELLLQKKGGEYVEKQTAS